MGFLITYFIIGTALGILTCKVGPRLEANFTASEAVYVMLVLTFFWPPLIAWITVDGFVEWLTHPGWRQS